jgi:FkbM family methyltransferase
MHPILAFTRNRRIPLSIRRLVGEWFIGKSDQVYELDIGSIYRGKLDNYVEWMVYVTGQYFEFPYINLIRRLFSKGVALDVGANVGNHSLAFSEFFDRVYGVEPYPPVYDRLAARREVTDKIHTYQIALSDRMGTASFKVPDTDNLGIGRIATEGELSVEVVRGDDFARTEIGTTVDFVKIDVEGHELEVIRGLAETFRSDRPIVIFEASRVVLKSSESIRDCFSLFPDDYLFHTLSGQSTWPVQQDVARSFPIDVERPTIRRRKCDIICFGRERNYQLAKWDSTIHPGGVLGFNRSWKVK